MASRANMILTTPLAPMLVWLLQEALAVIDWAFEAGWDPEDDAHGKGGMIYFKDAEVSGGHVCRHDLRQ